MNNLRSGVIICFFYCDERKVQKTDEKNGAENIFSKGDAKTEDNTLLNLTFGLFLHTWQSFSLSENSILKGRRSKMPMKARHQPIQKITKGYIKTAVTIDNKSGKLIILNRNPKI